MENYKVDRRRNFNPAPAVLVAGLGRAPHFTGFLPKAATGPGFDDLYAAVAFDGAEIV